MVLKMVLPWFSLAEASAAWTMQQCNVLRTAENLNPGGTVFKTWLHYFETPVAQFSVKCCIWFRVILCTLCIALQRTSSFNCYGAWPVKYSFTRHSLCLQVLTSALIRSCHFHFLLVYSEGISRSQQLNAKADLISNYIYCWSKYLLLLSDW